MKRLGWIVFIFFSVSVGFYPLRYLLADGPTGVLANRALFDTEVWRWAFYQHVAFGGIALLTGFTQFSKSLRKNRISLHRMLGKIYVASVLMSGLSGLYIAIYTFGGLTAQLGFSGLALGWLLTTTLAFVAIRRKRVDAHQNWMIRSYALTWAAVSLRLYLPLFEFGFDMPFAQSYPIIAWLCWVPNLMIAEWIIQR